MPRHSVAVAVAALALVAACEGGGASPSGPTRQEAADLLTEFYHLAQAT